MLWYDGFGWQLLNVSEGDGRDADQASTDTIMCRMQRHETKEDAVQSVTLEVQVRLR